MSPCKLGSSNCLSYLGNIPKKNNFYGIFSKILLKVKKNCDLTEIFLPCNFPSATTPFPQQSRHQNANEDGFLKIPQVTTMIKIEKKYNLTKNQVHQNFHNALTAKWVMAVGVFLSNHNKSNILLTTLSDFE